MSISMLKGVYNTLPNMSIKFDTPENMLRKASQIALPAIALFAMSYATQAEGFGCIGCGICLATGVTLPACAIPCALCVLTAPVPLG